MNRWTFSKVILDQGQLGYLFLSNRDPNAYSVYSDESASNSKAAAPTSILPPQQLHWAPRRPNTKGGLQLKQERNH